MSPYPLVGKVEMGSIEGNYYVLVDALVIQTKPNL